VPTFDNKLQDAIWRIANPRAAAAADAKKSAEAPDLGYQASLDQAVAIASVALDRYGNILGEIGKRVPLAGIQQLPNDGGQGTEGGDTTGEGDQPQRKPGEYPPGKTPPQSGARKSATLHDDIRRGLHGQTPRGAKAEPIQTDHQDAIHGMLTKDRKKK
jgi:hypothetical protein